MALPVNYNTVRVWGKFVYLDGTPASGSIKFTGKGTAAVSAAYDTIILPATITVALDATGSFEVNLPATDDPDITPNGWTYTVEEKFNGGGGRRYDIDVPIAAELTGINISDVSPAVPASGDPTTFVTLSSYVDSQNQFQETLLHAYGFIDGAIETCPRAFDFSTTLASGRVELSYVKAYRTVSVSKITVVSKGTSVGGLVGARMGIYSVDASDNLTLLARTAMITTGHLAGNWTNYGYPLDTTDGYPGSILLERDKTYAFGHFINYTGTNPTLRAYATNVPVTVAALSPKTAASISGQVDLPLTIATPAPSGNAAYFLASN